MTKSKYTILRAGNLYGRMRKVGETIELSEREAKYPLLNGMIEMVEEPASEKSTKRKPKKAATAKSGR